MAEPAQTIIATRGAQMFPTLTPDEMARLRRFGEAGSFAPGEALQRTGETGHGLMLILSGEVEVSQQTSTGRRTHIVTHRRGSFMGELAQLSGRPVAGRRDRADRRSRRWRSRPSGCARC